MLQTGLAVYAGDQILQTVQKLTGTALGLVYGMRESLVFLLFPSRPTPARGSARLTVFLLLDQIIADTPPPTVIWYIGSGTGTGSRPGLGAAFYILMLPALAIRLYAPPAMMQLTMMMAVTTVLVVSFPSGFRREGLRSVSRCSRLELTSVDAYRRRLVTRGAMRIYQLWVTLVSATTSLGNVLCSSSLEREPAPSLSRLSFR